METIFLRDPNIVVKANVFTEGFDFDKIIGPNVIHFVMGSETGLMTSLNGAG